MHWSGQHLGTSMGEGLLTRDKVVRLYDKVLKLSTRLEDISRGEGGRGEGI